MKFNIPPFDETLLKNLYEECSQIERLLEKNECTTEVLKSFNSKLIHSTNLENIKSYYSYCSQEDFIKGLLVPIAKKDPSITKDEFIELINTVMGADGEEYEQAYWLDILSKNLSSKISDMIYWAEDDKEFSPEEIYEQAIQDSKQAIRL